MLVSLIYLAQQTRQNSKHTRALIHQGRASRFAGVLIHMSSFELPEGWESCMQGRPNVDQNVLIQKFLVIFRLYMVNGEDTYLQYRDGLLDEDAFATFVNGNRNLMRSQGYRMAWQITRSMYGEKYRAFMDKTVSEAEAETSPGLFTQWNALAMNGAESLYQPA